MKGKILLVDDNREFLDSNKDNLEAEGYEVWTAESGEEALAITRTQSFDVILMDIIMPGMNGVESFIAMKRENPDVSVIMVTAYSVEELIHRALDEGAQAILNKPLDIGLLLEKIRALLPPRQGVVMVAEDDVGFADTLRDLLAAEGYAVVMAYNGQEAVTKAESEPIDVVLLDMKLPLLNGLQVYRRLRALRPGIVAIVMSGHVREMCGLIEQALKERVYLSLTKPFDLGRLLRVLSEVTGGRPQTTLPHSPA